MYIIDVYNSCIGSYMNSNLVYPSVIPDIADLIYTIHTISLFSIALSYANKAPYAQVWGCYSGFVIQNLAAYISLPVH